MFPRPIQKLRPIVSSCTRKYTGKQRYGRGFTHDELRAASISPEFARTVGIAVDHRRTCTSQEQMDINLQRLKDYKAKLILFPLKEGHPKKGDKMTLGDATAEALKTAAANNQLSGRVLPHSAAAQQDEFVALTKEDKERRVHSTTRVARVTKRYTGRRVKRAKDAAEKEANKK